MGSLTGLDMFKLLTCMHMHRLPSAPLYTACAAALAPKLGELQYAPAAELLGDSAMHQRPALDAVAVDNRAGSQILIIDWF